MKRRNSIKVTNLITENYTIEIQYYAHQYYTTCMFSNRLTRGINTMLSHFCVRNLDDHMNNLYEYTPGFHSALVSFLEYYLGKYPNRLKKWITINSNREIGISLSLETQLFERGLSL